jgi:hypothetical protein
MLGGSALGALVLMLASGGTRELIDVVSEGGLVPVIVGVLAALLLAGLVPLAATRAVPTALVVAVTLSPFWVGDALALYHLVRLGEAPSDPSMAAVLTAEGVSHYLNAHLAGATFSGALATSLAAGLALAAIARPASERQAGALVGLALGAVVLLLVGGAAVVSLVSGAGLGAVSFPVFVGLSALGTLSIAGAAASADRRAAELAAGAALAVSLALMCAAPLGSAHSMIEVFQVIPMAAFEDRASVLFQANVEIQQGFFVMLMVFGASLLVPVLLAARAARSGRLAGGSYVGGAAAAGLVLTTILLHIVVAAVAPTMVPGLDPIAVAAMIP